MWICSSHFPFCLQSNMLKSTFLFCSPLLVSVFAIQNITDDKRNGKLFSLFRCLEFLCTIVYDLKLYFIILVLFNFLIKFAPQPRIHFLMGEIRMIHLQCFYSRVEDVSDSGRMFWTRRLCSGFMCCRIWCLLHL